MLQIIEGAAFISALMLYLIPSIEADALAREDALAITVVNVLLGWTVIGWIAALMWARRPASERRLPHLLHRTRRAIAQRTIEKLVAHARSRGLTPGSARSARVVTGSSR